MNGNLVATLISCELTNVVLPFKKGVNCLEVFYHEASGGDGWYF